MHYNTKRLKIGKNIFYFERRVGGRFSAVMVLLSDT